MSFKKKSHIASIFLYIIIILVLFGCTVVEEPAFNNPVDPDSANYIGHSSEDFDEDGIPTYLDIDEIFLISPKNGDTIDTLTPELKVNQFDPNVVLNYWIQVSTSKDNFENCHYDIIAKYK